MFEVKTQKVNGKRCVAVNSFGYINTKVHKPYLAVMNAVGDPVWQDREYIGYGKHSEVFYCVEKLKPGDLIKAAGGSGGNKYPFVGIVKEVQEDALMVESMDYQEFGNIIAERKAAPERQLFAVSTYVAINRKDLPDVFGFGLAELLQSHSRKIVDESGNTTGLICRTEILPSLASRLEGDDAERGHQGIKTLGDATVVLVRWDA